jgi:hypothetical protein
MTTIEPSRLVHVVGGGRAKLAIDLAEYGIAATIGVPLGFWLHRKLVRGR